MSRLGGEKAGAIVADGAPPPTNSQDHLSLLIINMRLR